MVKIIQGDVREVLKGMASESVHCIVTSPPYWGLRDYGTAQWEGGSAECDHAQLRRENDNESKSATSGGQSRDSLAGRDTCRKCGARRIDSQLGLEKTPEEYVQKMVELFREVRRVLRKDGCAWINLGDSYAGSNMTGGNNGINISGGSDGFKMQRQFNRKSEYPGLKPKDLVGIPFRVAFALQQPHLKCKGCSHVSHQSLWGKWPNGRMICPSCYKSKGNEIEIPGWYLRQDIIWSKKNPMPESVTDRCTKSHEYIFLLTKSPRYWYDAEAIKEPASESDAAKERYKYNPSGWKKCKDNSDVNWTGNELSKYFPPNRNKRSVWEVSTAPFPGAHFATFPPKLIEPCILAGCPDRCCPKCGKGWERMVESTKTFESGSGRSGNPIHGKQNLTASETNSTPDIRKGPCIHTKTLGFRPSCACGETESVPGVVMDPFGGSGTVGMVSEENGRNSILIELNPKYVEMAKRRTAQRGVFTK